MQGVTPGGIENVLPPSREGQQAYLDGFQEVFTARVGKRAMADLLLRDHELSRLSERAHVQGLATVQGLASTRTVSAEFMREHQAERMRDALDGVAPEARRDEVQQMLNVMEDARLRHAVAATLREHSTFQRPAGLGTFQDRLTELQSRWARGGPAEFEAMDKTAIERRQKQVAKEVSALEDYRALRLECRSAMENGKPTEAMQLQEQAAQVFYREMDAGRISPELHQSLRSKNMDPGSLLEQVRGISLEHHQQVTAVAQIEAIRTQVPEAAGGAGFLFRAPGRFHEAPIPLAAYNHGGQERLAFLQGGRLQDLAVDEVRGDARHPGHALAVRFEAMQKEVAAGTPEQQDWAMARAGFLRVDGSLPASSGPWRSAPMHVGVDRTEAVGSPPG
jgi:hypothetical protein